MGIFSVEWLLHYQYMLGPCPFYMKPRCKIKPHVWYIWKGEGKEGKKEIKEAVAMTLRLGAQRPQAYIHNISIWNKVKRSLKANRSTWSGPCYLSYLIYLLLSLSEPLACPWKRVFLRTPSSKISLSGKFYSHLSTWPLFYKIYIWLLTI